MRKPIHFRSAYAPSPSPSTHRSPSPEDIPSLGLSESRLDETEATRAMLHKWDLMMGPPSDVDHDRGRRRGRARSMPARSKSRVRLWEEERDRGSRERDLRARQTGGELLDSDAEDRVLERLRRWPSSDEDRTGSASDDEERFSGHFITSDGVGMSMQVGVSSVDSLVFPASSDLDDDGWQPPPRHLRASEVLPSYFRRENSQDLDIPIRERVAHVDDLRNGEMKQFTFPVGSSSSILLSKVAGEVFATSSRCSHASAPLAAGALSGDGTVRCPWHGACFDVRTGDIEEGPALGALNAFKVEVESGNIYVTATPSTVEAASRPVKRCKVPRAGEESYGVVIIGGGAAALSCIDALREEGYDGRITLLAKEAFLPYNRTALSKSLLATPVADLLLRGDAFYEKLAVDEVVSVDFSAQKVRLLSNDDEQVSFEKLVIATGSVPRRLRIPGQDLIGIFVLQNFADAQEIALAMEDKSHRKRPKNVVIIGGGWIGTELAFAFSSVARVAVVERSTVLFEALLGKRVGTGIQHAHEARGVAFHLATSAAAFLPSRNAPDQVGSIQIEDGTVLPADLVLVCIGSKPATGFLKDSGVPLLPDGSVVVDRKLRVQGIDSRSVFAAGDIASFLSAQSQDLKRLTHWSHACNQGRAVGKVIVKGRPPHRDPAHVFWSSQIQQLHYVGTPRSSLWDTVIIRGDLAKLSFAAYYAIGEEIVAVASMQQDPLVAQCAELIRLRRMPSAEDIRMGVKPLEISLG